MRVGIDCRTILNPQGGERAGVGHYTYFLVKNLLALDQDNEYVLFFDSRFKKVDEFKRPRVKIRFFPFYEYKKYLPVSYSQILVSMFLSREKLDIFHSPANIIPMFYNQPAVVTIHDLAIYKYPDFFPAQFLNRQIFSTKFLVPRTLEKADKIIAVSKNTKTDIVEEFGVNEDKIEVVYEGIEAAVVKNLTVADCHWRKKFGINSKYILFLGTIEPRKNIVALIKAFRDLKMVYDSPLKDYQLVIAGARGWKDQPVYEAIADANASILGLPKRRSGLERRGGADSRKSEQAKKEGERRGGVERRRYDPVKYVGYVSHEEKMCLMSKTDCFVFPSLYEGFGLPVLEAMSLGVPVITSNLSSLPEVTGEKGAILINPNKENEIAEALQQVVSDEGLRESLIIKAKERAASFSWRKCAQGTLAVYQEVFQARNKKKIQ